MKCIWLAIPVWLLVSCISTPTPPLGQARLAPAGRLEPVGQPSIRLLPVPRAPSVRWSPSHPVTPAKTRVQQFNFPRVTPLDLAYWPFGWVDDEIQADRFALPRRFWTDQKPLWTRALDPGMAPSEVCRVLEVILQNAPGDDEKFRAVWHLWLACSGASMVHEARKWLDKAAKLKVHPTIQLEQAWDDVFRVKDSTQAFDFVRKFPAKWESSDDERKARILRKHLFLGTKSLAEVGADNNISTLILDQDDLWAGTWNGSVVRLSQSTGQADLILPQGAVVAPVKLLVATSWFLYVFQDRAFMRYSKVTGTWKSFDYPPGWTGLRVQAVVATGEEDLVVATLGTGLWKWSQGSWDLIDDRGGGPFLNSLVSDGQGGYWIGTKDRGLWNWKEGVWTPVLADGGAGPADISVVVPEPNGQRWAVGTWGEGTWMLQNGRLEPVSRGHEFVVGSGWDGETVLWATLDEGIICGSASNPMVLGPPDGIPAGSVSALVVWGHRWIWGTAGQGIGWWSENEDPALLR